jgi:hypothetical protein
MAELERRLLARVEAMTQAHIEENMDLSECVTALLRQVVRLLDGEWLRRVFYRSG